MSTTAVPAGTTFSGTRLIDSGRALSTAVKNGDWLDGGIALLDTLGDAAAALTDPIGTLTSCGLGWVMAHLKPLSTWLDQLTGSAQNVASVARQWTSAGSAMRQAGSDLARRLGDLDGLSGSSIAAYVRFADDAARHLGASGEWADAAASGLTAASDLVTKMQGVVKSAISQVISTAIEAMAVVAASWGLGMGYAIARVVQKVNQMVNKVIRPLRSVLASVKALTGLVSKLRSVFSDTASTTSQALRGEAHTVSLDAGTVVDASHATAYGNRAADEFLRAGRTADAFHFTTRPLDAITPATSVPLHLQGGVPTADGGVAGVASVGGVAAGAGAGAASIHLASGGASATQAAATGTSALHGSVMSGTAGMAAVGGMAATSGGGGLTGSARPFMPPMQSGTPSGGAPRSGLGVRRRDLKVVIEPND